jgi:hypothetical protein
MLTRDVFPRLTRPVREATLLEQPKRNPLHNTVPLLTHKQPEIKEK